MTEPNGTATITQAEMLDYTEVYDIMALFREKGLPLMDHPGILEPHPDYEYTENVDYSRHSITITWEKIQ